MGLFLQKEFISKEAALWRRLKEVGLHYDVERNMELCLDEALGPNAIASIPKEILKRPLLVVCAARDLEGPLMEELNETAGKYFVVVAGAGHYALAPIGEQDFDRRKYLDPKLVHAALTNSSDGNSHTKALKAVREHLVYFAASHCASEPLGPEGSKVGPTIQHLMDNSAKIRLFHALLQEGQTEPEGVERNGTGTGAPPAVISLALGLREEEGITDRLEVRMAGWNGGVDFIPGVREELPQGYLDRLQQGNVGVWFEGNHYSVQQVFFDQMRQISAMANSRPDLISKVTVDSSKSLFGRVFNVNGLPRTDYVLYGSDGQPLEEIGSPSP